jgi:5-methylthioadenosine/S-adenosylhomocysteine deaminase
MVLEGAAERDLVRTEDLLRRAAADPEGLFHAGVCPSSLLGYSDRYFAEAARLARRHDATLQVHAARDREEVEFCLSVFGRRPIERLADLGMIDDRLVCVHAILATPGEIATLGRAGAKVAHSAVEIINILNGIPHVGAMRMAGITVGLGCDNAVNDMFAVMHTAWALQVGHHGVAGYQPDVLTEDDVMAMATIDAARLLRLDASIGSIEVGKQADLVVLDGGGAHMMPLQAVPTDIVRFAGRSNVRDVFVRGEAVVRGGAPVGVDLDELRRAVERIGARLSGIVQPRRYKGLRGCC